MKVCRLALLLFLVLANDSSTAFLLSPSRNGAQHRQSSSWSSSSTLLHRWSSSSSINNNDNNNNIPAPPVDNNELLLLSSSFPQNNVGVDDFFLDDFEGEPDAVRHLLQDTFLLDATRTLLDPVTLGKLPSTVVSSAFHILHQWALTHSARGAHMVHCILTRFEQELAAGQSGLELTNKHYTVAVQAWAQSGDVKAAQRAEEALNRMVELAEHSPQLAPNRVAFHMVMSAYIKQGNLERALELLERMQLNPGLQPQTNDYNLLLVAYAQLGQARKAEDIMKRMVDQCRDDGSNTSAPVLISYNMLLDAWAKSGELGAGERAREILQMLQLQCISGECSFQPDVRTYSHVANAVIRSGGAAMMSSTEQEDMDQVSSNVVAAAKNILEQAEAMGITPDVYLHSTLLDAYASSSEPGAAMMAEERLNAMEEQGMANSVAYNTVIKAWKQSPHPEAAQRAEHILRRMEDLNMADTISYTTVIATYGIKGDKHSARRAEELYERMARAYEEGNIQAKPNTQTLNALMNAWVKCGNVDRAEQILLRMEQTSLDEGENAVVAPNVVSYSTVMNGWAKSGDKDAVSKAQQLFDQMNKMYKSGNHDARPNQFTYTTLIDAIVKSGDKEAAQKAQDTLFMMYNEYKQGNPDVKPNAQIITSLIDCWQKSGDPNAGERTEAILNWMINIARKENDPSLEPNEYTFSSVIAAWGKSKRFGKATRARRILQAMIDLHESGKLQAKPNTHCFTAVINCCAYSEKEATEKRTALQIAVETFQELSVKPQYGAPNHVTYSSLMTAIRNLMPPNEQRLTTIGKLFRKCCQAGQLDELMIRRMQTSLTVKQLKDIVGDAIVTAEGEVSLANLPPEWQSNLSIRSRKQPARNPVVPLR